MEKKAYPILCILILISALCNLMGLVGDEVIDFFIKSLKSNSFKQASVNWKAYLDTDKILQDLEDIPRPYCNLCYITSDEAEHLTDEDIKTIFICE